MVVVATVPFSAFARSCNPVSVACSDATGPSQLARIRPTTSPPTHPAIKPRMEPAPGSAVFPRGPPIADVTSSVYFLIRGFTFWMAGGGVKQGYIYGATDDYGYHAVEDRMHVHDFNATVLHLMGLDHEKVTYRYSGRDFRLTEVYGTVAKKILA